MAQNLRKRLQQSERDLFAPIAFRLSHSLEQVELSETANDAALASFVFGSAQRTLAADATVSWFDTWLEAEAAGVVIGRGSHDVVLSDAALPQDRVDVQATLAAPTIKTVLTTAQHLSGQTETGVVLGYLTAPATLARHLDADDPDRFHSEAVAIALGIARSHCEAGVSALLLADEHEADRPAVMWERSSALLNVAQYYETPIVYLCRAGVSPETADRLRDSPLLIADSPFTPDVVTFPVDASDFASAADRLAVDRSPRARLVLSAWDLEPGTPAEDIIQLGSALAL